MEWLTSIRKAIDYMEEHLDVRGKMILPPM